MKYKKRKKKSKKRINKRKRDYNAYIKSVKWRNFKKAILKDRGYYCELCGDKFLNLDLHHIHYDNFKKELPGDVLLLCRGCHFKLHKVIARPPYSILRFTKLKRNIKTA